MAVETEALKLIEMTGVQTRLTEDEEGALLRVLRESNSLATSTEGEAFEKEFTAFIGSGDSVCLSSCSSALEMAAKLTDLQPGQEVIVPAHTFVATAVPFARTGATLRWADIDPNTCIMTAETIEPLISDATRVIVVVHLYGLSADMDPILALAEKHGLQVVEDCAQAPGARYKGDRVGTLGHFGCYSFHTQKNITTLGEGGMLTVRNPAHGVQARRLRWMGNWPFDGEREAYWKPAMSNVVEPMPGKLPVNYCMGEPNAAVGRLLIKRLDQINEQRRHQADRFREALREDGELVFQKVTDGCEHAYHLMVARFDGQAMDKNRDDLIARLFDAYALKCIVQYWPLYRTELFKSLGFGDADVPESDRFFDNMISFPWWSDMSDSLIDDMANRVKSAIGDLRGESD